MALTGRHLTACAALPLACLINAECLRGFPSVNPSSLFRFGSVWPYDIDVCVVMRGTQ